MFGRKAKIIYSVVFILFILYTESFHFTYIYHSYTKGNSVIKYGLDFYNILILLPILLFLGYIFLSKYIKFRYALITYLLLFIVQVSPLHQECNISGGGLRLVPGVETVDRCECLGIMSSYERNPGFDTPHIDYCVGFVERRYQTKERIE